MAAVGTGLLLLGIALLASVKGFDPETSGDAVSVMVSYIFLFAVAGVGLLVAGGGGILLLIGGVSLLIGFRGIGKSG